MQIDQYIRSLDRQIDGMASPTLRITDEEIAAMKPEERIRVKNHFQGRALMHLPAKEVAFFTWLKEMDPAVWEDLWPPQEEPYVVGLSFLEQLGPEGNGFPICDLHAAENYFFTERHIKIPDGVTALQEIIQKITRHSSISVGEALMYEAFCSPIDIWHFAYRHHVPLAAAKEAVAALDMGGLLVHLTNPDDLVDYIEF